MSIEDIFENWRKARSDVEPDEGFADGILREVRRHDRRWREAGYSPLGRSQGGGVSRPWLGVVGAAVMLLCVVLGILRLGSVVLFILLSCSEGF